MAQEPRPTQRAPGEGGAEGSRLPKSQAPRCAPEDGVQRARWGSGSGPGALRCSDTLAKPTVTGEGTEG